MITEWLYLNRKLITKIVLSRIAHMLHVPNIGKVKILKLGQLTYWKYTVTKNSNIDQSVTFWRHAYLLCVPDDGVAFFPQFQRHLLLFYTICFQHQTPHLTTEKRFQLTTLWCLENHKLFRSLRGLHLCTFLTLLNILPTDILLTGHKNTRTHTPQLYNRRTQYMF